MKGAGFRALDDVKSVLRGFGQAARARIAALSVGVGSTDIGTSTRVLPHRVPTSVRVDLVGEEQDANAALLFETYGPSVL